MNNIKEAEKLPFCFMSIKNSPIIVHISEYERKFVFLLLEKSLQSELGVLKEMEE